MANFKESFQYKHVVLPVIHAKTEEQVLSNAKVAYEAGCDGVFLINMENERKLFGMNYIKLMELYQLVKEEFAPWWIGVNCLDLPTADVFKNITPSVSGVWADNAGINERLKEQLDAEEVKLAREKSNWKGLYFGGVAFKYQPDVDNPGLTAKIATNFVDVVTTSGKATGSAPDLTKIKLMKDRMGDFPLAIASGVSPENVKQFLPYADCFIVATSLLIPGTENFDKDKIKALIDNVRG